LRCALCAEDAAAIETIVETVKKVAQNEEVTLNIINSISKIPFKDKCGVFLAQEWGGQKKPR